MNKNIEMYLNTLLKDKVDTTAVKQHAQTLKKGRSALEFYFMLDNCHKFTVRKWATRWGVSTSTASKWLNEFEEIYRQHTRL